MIPAVARASRSATNQPARKPRAPSASHVMPLARALSVLGAFTLKDRWLGNHDFCARTGLPAATVSRVANSLARLGYLHHDKTLGKFRLAPAVLTLGYAVDADTGPPGDMQGFAANGDAP